MKNKKYTIPRLNIGLYFFVPEQHGLIIPREQSLPNGVSDFASPESKPYENKL
jgi:hypothetical protein